MNKFLLAGGTGDTPSPFDPDAFVLEVDSTINNTTGIGFRSVASIPVNCVIDWGDGSSPTPVSGVADNSVITHTYAVPGTYFIQITGSVTRFLDSYGTNTQPFRQNIVGCVQWGNIFTPGTNFTGGLHGAFSWCVNLDYVPDHLPNLPWEWDAGRMFQQCTNFNQDISGWDTENIRGMLEMFFNCTSFNQDLSNWCVGWIPSQPTNFATNTPAWTLPKPVWGTCPLKEPDGPVEFIGYTSGTTSITNIPPHQAGDVIFIAAWGASVTPSVPSGWTSYSGGTGRLLVAFRVATSGSTQGTSISNSSNVSCAVYRNVKFPPIFTPSLGLVSAARSSNSSNRLEYNGQQSWAGLAQTIAFGGYNNNTGNIVPTGVGGVTRGTRSGNRVTAIWDANESDNGWSGIVFSNFINSAAWGTLTGRLYNNLRNK